MKSKKCSENYKHMARSHKIHNKKPPHSMWVYGIHSVLAAIQNPDRNILRLCVLSSIHSQYFDEIKHRKNISAEIVDQQFFLSQFGKNAVHQGIAALVGDLPQTYLEDILEEEGNAPVIILDQITDPHNIGAIIRSAAVFNARCVILQENNSPQLTSSLAKSASGGLELIPTVRVTNISNTIKKLKDHFFWCVTLEEDASKEIHQFDLHNDKFAFIIGSEGDGVRRLIRESCDFTAKIPTGDFSTLNAAQACTIMLYESFKQRCCH